MAPLLALSVLSITLVLERAFFWLRARGRPSRSLLQAARSGSFDKAEQAAKRSPGLAGAFARQILTATREGREPGPAAAGIVEDLRPRMERWNSTFAAIITSAPMLGILGTVTGIIRSFSAYRTDTAMQLDGVADGIAEALITTAIGLGIALVTLFPAALFRALATRSMGSMRQVWSAVTEGASGREARAGKAADPS